MENLSHGAGLGDEYQRIAQAQDLNELNKALTADQVTGGSTVDTSTSGSGAPLKVESLDRSLKNLTYRMQDIRLYNLFPKNAAYNTVEEFNQLDSYGVERGGSYLEGELPEEEQSTYTRRAEKVKYYGVTRSVSHPMQLVNTMLPSVLQQEINNGMMWVLRKINRSLAFGDEDIVSTELNGVYKQHQKYVADSLDGYFTNEVLVDLEGASLTQEIVESAGTLILNNFGSATHLFSSPEVLSDFGKDYYQKQRIFLGGNQQGYNEGINISYPKHVTLSFGDVALEHDIFLKSNRFRRTTEGAQSSKAPTKPTAVTIAAAAGTGKTFTTANGVGSYYYAIASVNRFGESDLTALNSGSQVAVANGEVVNITVTDGGGANAATGYVVYRSTVNDTAATIADAKMYPILKISKAEFTAGYDGAGAGVIRDRNRIVSGTDQGFIADVPNTFTIKQLAPMMKMDLAVLSPATRFMVLSYLTLQLHAPRKVVRFINVGKFVAP